MAKNFLEEFRQKKDKLVELAQKAGKYGWIDDGRVKDIMAKLDADVLTIGVIGQMKCGKSTFLNAFVFEDDVLPSATTPMTAALSVITYGETAKVVAEFYTEDEWLEQCSLAQQSMSGLSDADASKVKAAKELLEKSAPIQDNIGEYLGKTREDTLENIIDYVGADGRYVSITKAVKIFYPKEYLKGVEIVDTPGFNDPIVSRELRTQEFLKKADVVVMMLYAGRPFDSTDRTILFENVKQCGIGKVLIGVNKYDLPYENGELPEEIKQYVIDQIHEQCQQLRDDTMLDILKNAEPILLSAEMALLSELPMSRIVANEAYDHAYKRYANELEIVGQLRLREMSRMDDLADAIKAVVEQEKYDVLLKKPINSILAAGSKKYDDIITEITNANAEVRILSTPDEELEEKEYNLSRAERRLSKKFEGLSDDLNIIVAEMAISGRNDLEDAMDACCKKMERVVEGVGRFENFDKIKPRLTQIETEFRTRTSKRIVEQLATQMKIKLKSTTKEFFIDVTDIINRYIPDVESREFVKEVERQINLKIEDESIFCMSFSEEQKSKTIAQYLFDVCSIVPCVGATRLACRGFSHDENKIALLQQINTARYSFDAKVIVDTILSGKDNVINLIKKKFMDDLISPLSEKVAECRTSLEQKEVNLSGAKARCAQLESDKQELELQMKTIKSLV